MKFSITFKTPGADDQAVDDATGPYTTGEEQEELKEQIEQFTSKWLRYGEVLIVDFDMEAGTAVVRETE